MKHSRTGEFYGETNEKISLEGVTLTDTEYTQDRVDWHFHENDYFTFILEGAVLEGNKKEIYECSAGDLLYHNWEDAHYNIKSDRFTRGFHVELESKWFETFDIRQDLTQGSIHITNPRIKTLMYALFKEAKLTGKGGQPGIDALLIQIFSILGEIRTSKDYGTPKWVGRIREILEDDPEDRGLEDLAKLLDIHPVHLSRAFPRYFKTSLGDYVRAVKIQRAMSLLPDRELSLTDIAFESGFADQSHFIRCFKGFYQITPLAYRALLKKCEG